MVRFYKEGGGGGERGGVEWEGERGEEGERRGGEGVISKEKYKIKKG
jgi:hypothetical protein